MRVTYLSRTVMVTMTWKEWHEMTQSVLNNADGLDDYGPDSHYRQLLRLFDKAAKATDDGKRAYEEKRWRRKHKPIPVRKATRADLEEMNGQT